MGGSEPLHLSRSSDGACAVKIFSQKLILIFYYQKGCRRAVFFYAKNISKYSDILEMHKIKMASQGFEDSGQNVKMIKDSSVVPTGYMQDSYVYYGGYTKQETVRKDNVF